jgi:hypothetical protein
MIRRLPDGVIEMALEVPPMRGFLKLFFNSMTEEDALRDLLDGKMVSFEDQYTMLVKESRIEIAGPTIAFSSPCDVEAMRKALGPVQEN